MSATAFLQLVTKQSSRLTDQCDDLESGIDDAKDVRYILYACKPQVPVHSMDLTK